MRLTFHRKLSAATTNATIVAAGSVKLYTGYVYNTSAAVKFLKLYDKATAPTVGTDVPVATLPIAPSQALNLGADFGGHGRYFNLGLAYAITGLVADTDTTAVAANDVVVNLGYN